MIEDAFYKLQVTVYCPELDIYPQGGYRRCIEQFKISGGTPQKDE